MNTKNIQHAIFLVFIVTSFLINGCSENNSSQSDPIRRIDLEGQRNFRDLGGYTNIHGESVRWRILFRSGDLYELTDADRRIVNDLDLQLVIDFRSKEEWDKRPDRSPAGAQTLHDPITLKKFVEMLDHVKETGDTSQLTVGNISDIFENIYTDYAEKFEMMLSEVMYNENRPALIHCTSGKDRTGFGAALILASLQVPDEVIFEDYLLSSEYLKDSTEVFLDKLKNIIEHNTGNTPTEADMERIRNLAEVRQEYIEIAFQNVVDEYGSFEEFIINGLEISKDEIEEFRSHVLVSLN